LRPGSVLRNDDVAGLARHVKVSSNFHRSIGGETGIAAVWPWIAHRGSADGGHDSGPSGALLE
jgi:hypothetical protein